MALPETHPKVLDQKYCLVRPQFGTVKLFNPNHLSPSLVPMSWAMPVPSLASNDGQDLLSMQGAS